MIDLATDFDEGAVSKNSKSGVTDNNNIDNARGHSCGIYTLHYPVEQAGDFLGPRVEAGKGVCHLRGQVAYAVYSCCLRKCADAPQAASLADVD